MSHFAIQGRVVMDFFVTGQDQSKEKLPLKLSDIQAADGDETHDDEIRGSETISGSSLWHSGRPDLIQWVPKLRMLGRNVIIGKLVNSVVVDESIASQANIKKGAESQDSF